jgi:antitoxin (DNA-binding transcriptional repressor) of toxin-antitoxin stability system
VASTQVNLYEAKTQLSSLVERAAKGEEIIIAKAGKPLARLSALTAPESAADPDSPKIYRDFDEDVLGITFLADNWEDDIPLEYFQDEGEENPFGEVSETVESK